jgi:hypothetical protein
MSCDSSNEDNSIANGYTPPLPFPPDRAASVSMPAANNAPPA